MTLIASTLRKGTPFLIADILISSVKGNISRFPSAYYKTAVLTKRKVKPDSLAQKIYIIEKNVCAIFSGNVSEIEEFLKELRTRCSYYCDTGVKAQHIQRFLDEYDKETMFAESTVVISIIERQDGGFRQYQFACGQRSHRSTAEFGNIIVSGSGTTQFLEHVQSPIKVTYESEDQNDALEVNLYLLARLLVHERETGYNLEENWGGGYEIAHFNFVKEEFEKLDEVAFVVWRADIDKTGDVNQVNPEAIFYNKYIDDVLYLVAIDINDYEAFNDDAFIKIKSQNCRVNIFPVQPLHYDKPVVNKKDEELDFSFETNHAPQGFGFHNVSLPEVQTLSAAYIPKETECVVTYKEPGEIQIKIPSHCIKNVEEFAKATFPNASKHRLD